jgi:integrase/recombinase XerD
MGRRGPGRRAGLFCRLGAREAGACSRARPSALRQFFRFLQREEQVAANPVELLDSPRLPRRLPQVMGEEDVAALLAAPDRATPGGLRDQALLRCSMPRASGSRSWWA